jgi:hypothetical protein
MWWKIETLRGRHALFIGSNVGEVIFTLIAVK